MKIGVGLPAYIPWARPEVLLEWARRADQGPFSSLGSIDRLVYRNYDPLVVFSAAGGVTHRIGLMTTILLGALHNPAILAKQAATLDALSGGRLTLGLAVGSREEDYRAAHVDFDHRGRRLSAEILMMKRIWNGEPSSAEAGVIGPAPARKGGPPILLGGHTPASIQRAARLADGFITGGLRIPGVVEQIFRAANRAWQEAGRQDTPCCVSAAYVALGEDPAGRGGEYLRDYYGPMAEKVTQGLLTQPQALVDAIHGFDEAGADELILWPAVPGLEQLDRLIEIVAKLG